MTDYNDGKWHKMEQEMPLSVDQRSMVEMKWMIISDGSIETSRRPASAFVWGDTSNTIGIAFRVTKPYHEPKEIYVLKVPGCEYDEYRIVPRGTTGAVKFREVIE